jgi:hypothetical protein
VDGAIQAVLAALASGLSWAEVRAARRSACRAASRLARRARITWL